ncbi:uncharacterized protein LOC143887548 isoform X2 [Tasmannia lanceolata]|uniref:uncharacterized protein LOC143887548 isoform X2 n=1 Tax=Tasmannia lanceolata TaxID=3420 RepID=UPI0040628FAE
MSCIEHWTQLFVTLLIRFRSCMRNLRISSCCVPKLASEMRWYGIPSEENEKLHQWIMRRQEEGPRVNVADIVAYLQNELNYGGEDALMPPPPQNPNSNAQMLFSTPSIQMPQGAFGPATCGQGSRTFFANALSSPVRSSLQPFHMAHGGVYGGNVLQGSNAGYGAGPDNQVFHSADGSQSADDSAMDMHTEGSSYE